MEIHTLRNFMQPCRLHISPPKNNDQAYLRDKFVDLVSRAQMSEINSLIAKSLQNGHLCAKDICETSDQLFSAFKKSELNAGHSVAATQTAWLLRSWEIAAKISLIPQILTEMGSVQKQQSQTLRKIYASVRQIMHEFYDVSYYKNNKLVRIDASPLGSHAANGIFRFSYIFNCNLSWNKKPLDKKTKFSSFEDEYEYHSEVGRFRIGPCIYTENINNSIFNDGSPMFRQFGTAFISLDTESLDLFIRTRKDLSKFEEAVYYSIFDSDKLDELLSSELNADSIAEHHYQAERLLTIILNSDEINFESIKTLINHGTHPGRLSFEEESPLSILMMRYKNLSMNIIEEDIHDIIDALIEAGADVNEQNMDGKTPLVFACEFAPINIIGHLMNRGASPLTKDRNNVSLLDMTDPQFNGQGIKLRNSVIAYLQSWQARKAIESIMSEKCISRSTASSFT